MSMQLQIMFLAVMIIFSAFFALAETSLLTLSRFKIRHWVEKKKFGADYIKKLRDNPENLLSTILIGNNLANTAAAAITTSIVIELVHDNAIGIATGIGTFLILVFGDILPKTIGTNNNEAIAPFVAPIIYNISIVIYPILVILEYFLKAMNKLVGIKKVSIITKDELKSIVKASKEEGAIKDIEKLMIHRIFDFENTTVEDVMTRKKHMTFVSADMPVRDVLSLPNTKMYSRFPVYDKNKDNIVGIFYLKDALKLVKDGKLETPVRQLMQKPFFVFSHKKMDAMLRLFQQRKQHMAVVIDQKARVIGLVTIENILEEIVGEIIDESDRINPGVVQTGKNEWVVRGSIEIDNLNSKIGTSISSDHIDLDGFIMATLGRYPKLGEEVVHQNYKIKMEDVQGRKVVQARILKG